jgi:hypothetical protein
MNEQTTLNARFSGPNNKKNNKNNKINKERQALRNQIKDKKVSRVKSNLVGTRLNTNGNFIEKDGILIPKRNFQVKKDKLTWMGITDGQSSSILDCLLCPDCVDASSHLPINCGSAIYLRPQIGSSLVQSAQNGRDNQASGFSNILIATDDALFPIFQSKGDTSFTDGYSVADIAQNASLEIESIDGNMNGLLRHRVAATRNLDNRAFLTMDLPNPVSNAYPPIISAFRVTENMVTKLSLSKFSTVDAVTILYGNATFTTDELDGVITSLTAVTGIDYTSAGATIAGADWFAVFPDPIANTKTGVIRLEYPFVAGLFTAITFLGPFCLAGVSCTELTKFFPQISGIRVNSTSVTGTYFPDHQFGGGSLVAFLFMGGESPQSSWNSYGFTRRQRSVGRMWDGFHVARFPTVEETVFLDAEALPLNPTRNPFQRSDSQIAMVVMAYTPQIAATLASLPFQFKTKVWYEGSTNVPSSGGEQVNERTEAVLALLSAVGIAFTPSENPTHKDMIRAVKKVSDYILHSNDSLPVAIRKVSNQLLSSGSDKIAGLISTAL